METVWEPKMIDKYFPLNLIFGKNNNNDQRYPKYCVIQKLFE